MRQEVLAVLAVTCLLLGCARQPAAIGGAGGSASDQAAPGGMQVQLQTKDGKAFDINLPPPNGKPEAVKGVDDLFNIFTEFCLEAFPDDAAVTKKAKSSAYEALTPEDVGADLDGGHGD